MARSRERGYRRSRLGGWLGWLLVALTALSASGCGPDGAETPSQAAGAAAGTGGANGSGGAGEGGAGAGGRANSLEAVFDPGRVYLVGQLANYGNFMGIVDWAAPDVVFYGFRALECEFTFPNMQIHPKDSRALAVCGDKLDYDLAVHAVQCDECPYVPDPTKYPPEDPLKNDPIVSPEPCQGLAGHAEDFVVAADGELFWQCSDFDPNWYDASGVAVYEETGMDQLLHVGHGRRALTQQRIVELGSTNSVDLVGLPPGEIQTARAVAPDRFWVVMYLDEGTNPEEQDDQELWEIDASGMATLVGAYPPAPSGYVAGGPKIDAQGVMYQRGHTLADGELDSIVRREIGGKSEIVYDDNKGPLIEVTYSGRLFTGP